MLSAALAEFDRLGAPLWVDRTRDELGRIGGRAPSAGGLTEAEQRIAELVVAGRTNRLPAGRILDPSIPGPAGPPRAPARQDWSRRWGRWLWAWV